MELKKLQQEIHNNAIKKGFWEDERPDSEMIALCHAELSEALEELRKGREPNEIYFKGEKPEGVPVELADCIIRILDYCGRYKINIEYVINLKHNYNKTRPYKHGKQF